MATTTSSFDPVALGLPQDFLLTDYTRLKGCSCKLPQPKLVALLQNLEEDPRNGETTPSPTPVVNMMDCSVIPLRPHSQPDKGVEGTSPSSALPQQYLVSTTDFFFPSVEDPFIQGQIGAANVLSDLYSVGITHCDNMLMLLASSTDMDEHERTVVTREILRGFAERVRLAQTCVTGGQTVMNPWPLIGGVAMSVVTEEEMILPTGLQVGDVLVLTKPLGTQLAVNLQQWVRRPSPVYEKCIRSHISEEEIQELYVAACDSMKRLNRTAASLMHTYGAHGATDVTGFGILGHAQNLGAATTPFSVAHRSPEGGVVQDESAGHGETGVCLVLDTLPMFHVAVKASRLMGDRVPYRLLDGLSAETSGGLLVALKDRETAEAYIHAIQEQKEFPEEAAPAWIVGHVEARGPDGVTAGLADNVQIVEV